MSYKKNSTYVARPVDAKGVAAYSAEENMIWHDLMIRQTKIIQNRACDEYIHGLEILSLPKDRIPQCFEISEALNKETGWNLEAVPALIPFEKFFQLLATRRFPAATFIRRREDMDYLQEPDIFHEVFGHCPLLTNPAYAAFTHTYGKLGLNASSEDRALLARLFWFTNEFGLIQNPAGLRVYGGGILSSSGETQYSLESDIPKRRPFDVLEALRTPYRIDIMQPVYFVLENFDTLFELTNIDLISLVKEARKLGDLPPSYKLNTMES